MTALEPSHTHKLLRDPLYNYVTIPEELMPLVLSLPVQRLRSISQNSRAIAAFPSLNGSRFEHSLGTMHLAMQGWRHAWSNIWSLGIDDDDLPSAQDALRNKFALAVLKDVRAEIEHPDAKADPFTSSLLQGTQRHVQDEWRRQFPTLMVHAIGIVGLVHDLGHPPFSHVLEDPFSFNAASIFPEEFVRYSTAKLQEEVQFHEAAGDYILEHLLDLECGRHVSTSIVRIIAQAREKAVSSPSWARSIHQLIDGQIDVDRLDYICRDSLRAGTDYHAIDVDRLISNLELHERSDKSWTIGVGIRGISSMEALLLHREQSYRWMIFHQKAVVADAALKRVTSYAMSQADKKTLQQLNYVTRWPSDDKTGSSGSYGVDDHLMTVWLRGARSKWNEPGNAEHERHQALARIWDELSQDYCASWRTYGDFRKALIANRTFLEAAGISGATPSENVATDPRETAIQAQADSPRADPIAREFNSVARKIWEADGEMDQVLERRLNEDVAILEGHRGTWLVVQKFGFRPFKDGLVRVWSGDEDIDFGHVSPIAEGLRDAEFKRPVITAFFVPLSSKSGFDSAALRPHVQAALIRAFCTEFLSPVTVDT